MKSGMQKIVTLCATVFRFTPLYVMKRLKLLLFATIVNYINDPVPKTASTCAKGESEKRCLSPHHLAATLEATTKKYDCDPVSLKKERPGRVPW